MSSMTVGENYVGFAFYQAGQRKNNQAAAWIRKNNWPWASRRFCD
jgi:hypothetical protein|tara:strand:- start:70 stop:204 length:135 start_codon:yes stop_codon:yes gene_type:complete